MGEVDSSSILVVDDTPANIAILREVLKGRYRVRVATSGERALEIAHATPRPDLILLDIMMPEMDGREVCRRLKADEATAGIPVIFVTAKSEVEDEEAGLRLGAVDYIAKPVSPPIVLARVETHLALSQARRALEEQNLELRETARLREDVESITRHDLKTPLTCIIGMPPLIAASDNLSAEQEEFLKIIEESGYRMLQMINSSLDLYKMERGTYQFKPECVNVCPIIHRVLRELDDLMRGAGCRACIRMDSRAAAPVDVFEIWAEELLTYSLLANLIKNAIEASPDGESITLSLTSGSDPSVTIHNRGEVPEEVRDTFFEKYATAGKKGGTGLGTYSARLIAQTQGGGISMDTSAEEGTTLTVSFLPVSGTREQAPDGEPGE
jgi:CheY-like chemotaxis protein